MIRLAGALGAAFLFATPSALAAPTSWTATQKSTSPGQPTSQSAEVSYGHHRLRIDNPQQRLIVDFATGSLIYVDVEEKRYARITLEEMVALRDKQLKAVEAQLDKMPPQIRQQMEAQIAEAKKKSKVSIDAKPTDESDEVSGLDCEIYAWTSSEGNGRACIAKKVPFDPSAFQKDSERLARRMEKLGAGSAAASMAILRLGKLGFPVRIDQQMRMGQRTMEVVSTFEDLEAKKLPKGHFAPPSNFTKMDFEAMMQKKVNAAPPMPAR